MNLDYSRLRPSEKFVPKRYDIDSEEVVLLELDKLEVNENNPFKAISSDEMSDLQDSIELLGLINPIIVRPIKEKHAYQILAGHNRVKAYKNLNKDKIESIVKDIDDSKAKLIMIDSNLQQRLNIKPSEKAKAYRIQISILNREKWDNKIIAVLEEVENSSLIEEKDTVSKIAELYGESKANIYRYVRLSYLITDLLDLVDSKVISIDLGVRISYLNTTTQKLIKEYFYSDNPQNILTYSFVAVLRETEKSNEITSELFEDIIRKRKKKDYFSKVNVSIKKIKKEIDIDFETKEEVENFLISAVKYYKENYLDKEVEL